MADPEGAGRTPRKKPQGREGTPGKSYEAERVVFLLRINQERGHRGVARAGDRRGSAQQQRRVQQNPHQV